MSRKRLERRLGNVEDVGIATLEGYKITFNKVSNDGTGKTNIIPHNGIVLGVAFILTEAQFAELDKREVGYHRETINVTLNNNVIKMETYVADSNCINNELLPTRAYCQFLIDGAIEHKFPQEYIDFLTTEPTVD